MDHKLERLLVVDDEKSIRLVIGEALEAQGYQVVAVADPQHALQECERKEFDLALVDLKMPGAMSGMDLLAAIHERWRQTMVIMMTGYGTLDSAIDALRQGAIDYITKPASISQIISSVELGLAKRRQELSKRELITQIEQTLVKLKQDHGLGSSESIGAGRFFQMSGLTIDREKRLVAKAGVGINLTATEFDLLDYLASHTNRVVTASELAQATQGYQISEKDARPIIRVHIRRLRQKLEENPKQPRIVLNVRGKGYRFAG